MELRRLKRRYVLVGILLNVMFLVPSAYAIVLIERDKTYIVDQTGERWDITQAVSLGYDPHHFEFGIGRHVFETLDDRHWDSGSDAVFVNMRIIGVAGNGDVHAYSVAKLRYHETANTFLGGQPIVAGY